MGKFSVRERIKESLVHAKLCKNRSRDCTTCRYITCDHVKPALEQLHWLPVEQRISYKLCLLMHYIHTGQAPQYLSNCVSTISSSDRVTRLTTYCREHAPSLANVVRLLRSGRLEHCHLTYMTLLTLTYSRNDLKLFCSIVRCCCTALLDGSYYRAAPCKSLIVLCSYYILGDAF